MTYCWRPPDSPAVQPVVGKFLPKPPTRLRPRARGSGLGGVSRCTGAPGSQRGHRDGGQRRRTAEAAVAEAVPSPQERRAPARRAPQGGWPPARSATEQPRLGTRRANTGARVGRPELSCRRSHGCPHGRRPAGGLRVAVCTPRRAPRPLDMRGPRCPPRPAAGAAAVRFERTDQNPASLVRKCVIFPLKNSTFNNEGKIQSVTSAHAAAPFKVMKRPFSVAGAPRPARWDPPSSSIASRCPRARSAPALGLPRPSARPRPRPALTLWHRSPSALHRGSGARGHQGDGGMCRASARPRPAPLPSPHGSRLSLTHR